MKKALYIGIYSEGSTSKMRGEKLKALLPGWNFETIDIDIPFQKQSRLFRSLGFRYKFGPVITAINSFIKKNLQHDQYDLIWVDKAMLITVSTTNRLKKLTSKLIHYTPDTAFYANKSGMFYKSAPFYDYLITTKKFDIPAYERLVPKEKLIVTTQGFDEKIHRPSTAFEKKLNRVAFAGLAEPSREQILQQLVDNNITIALAGYGWENFLKRNNNNPLVEFKGLSVWDEDYTSLISSSYFSIGLLSKRFPEMHTTRTLEIPACGTALLTERTDETSFFFSDEEAVFFTGSTELVEKIKYFQQHIEELKILTSNGTKKVNEAGFSYTAILEKILARVL